jgi:hypothetical protein
MLANLTDSAAFVPRILISGGGDAV